jgi:hypothetical protein
MNRLYTTAPAAMVAAYELSMLTHKRVWRHQVTDKHGNTRWLVTLNENAQNALQELTA